jgi:hypothetical protein
MVRAVVGQVAALTEALEIARPVISRIVIEVGGGQDDASPSYPCHLLDIGPGGGSAMVVLRQGPALPHLYGRRSGGSPREPVAVAASCRVPNT